MGKELEALRKRIYNISNSYFPLDSFFNDICNIEDKDYDKEQAYKDIEKICSLFEKLLKEQERKEKLEKVIKDLFSNHIELVRLDNCCYFKIKNSKGCERSYTSKTFEDFWKVIEVLEESK